MIVPLGLGDVVAETPTYRDAACVRQARYPQASRPETIQSNERGVRAAQAM